MTKPKVSVILSAYNAMSYIQKTVDSLWQQTCTDFEFIMIDDGSSDGTKEWAESLTDPRLRFFPQENQGLARALNRGIQESRGEFVAFLDHDDMWHPTKLEKQVASLESHPEAGLSYTWTALMDSTDEKSGRIFQSHAEGYVWKELILDNFVASGSTPLIRKSCFEKCGVFDTRFRTTTQDWDMWLRIALEYPFTVIKEPLTYYRQHEGSASRNWREMEEFYHKTLDKAFGLAEEKYTKEELESLRAPALANVLLALAWKPIQTKDKSLVEARRFQKEAIEAYLDIKKSKEYYRLSLALFLLQIFGEKGYRTILSIVYSVRSTIAFR